MLRVLVSSAVYKNMDECLNKYKEADVLINFASLRSAYESTMEVLEKHPQVLYFHAQAGLGRRAPMQYIWRSSGVLVSSRVVLVLVQVRVVVIIAEGIPEQLTRRMNKLAASRGVTIIGPATVGGIKPGCIKLGTSRLLLLLLRVLLLLLSLLLVGRKMPPVRVFSRRQLGRNDGQHPVGAPVPAGFGGVREPLGRHVERAEQHHRAQH